ncbi:hypothetical protein [Moheibacter sediminis]|nr:hypothetical protein [Moheibacter sediminis]
MFSSVVFPQVGIGLENFKPETSLHIVGDQVNSPLGLRGITTTLSDTDVYLIHDTDDKVYKMNRLDGVAFVIPTVFNTNGIELTTAMNTGNVTYNLGVETPASVNKWHLIPGMTSTFEMLQDTNILNISIEGLSQYGVTGAFVNLGTNIYYTVGIFIDGILTDARILTFRGNGQSNLVDKWNVSSHVKNLSKGTHTIQVYVSRRNGSSTSSQDERSIMVGTSSVGVSNNNDFMSRIVLNCFGRYGN